MMEFANNVTRRLDSLHIAYTCFTYDYAESRHSAVAVADILDLPREQVYKTLVVRDPTTPRSFALCMLPGPGKLDLKIVSRHLNLKKAVMATPQQAETWTGMKTGGISPLAMSVKGCSCLLDEEAHCWDDIVLSAGERGRQLQINVGALISLLNPLLLPLS